MKNQHIKEKKFIQSFLDDKCKNSQYAGQIFDIRLDELLKEFLDSWNSNVMENLEKIIHKSDLCKAANKDADWVTRRTRKRDLIKAIRELVGDK